MLPMWKCCQCQNPIPNSSGDIDNWQHWYWLFPHFHIIFSPFPVPHSPFPYTATAPKQGNCRGCACAFRAESAATLRQASFAVSPGARPVAVPGRLERLLRSIGKTGKHFVATNFPRTFLIRRRRFPICCAVAKPHGIDAVAWGLHQCGHIKGRWFAVSRVRNSFQSPAR